MRTGTVGSFLVVAVLAAAVIALGVSATHTEVTSLPGVDHLGEKQYTGYITVDSNKNGNLFYWLFESRSDPSTDPLVMWLTGGPGCSSELAMLFENGPYRMEVGSEELKNNPYGWNSKANLLFVDQPVNTGFSYANNYVRTEEEVADDMYVFLQQFLKEFPQYANRDFYLTGESFAGHYIPAVSARILAGNSNPGATIIRLRGIAIGNGWIDPYLQYPDYVPFALENQLIDSSTAKSLNTTARHCQSLINDKLYTLANIECSSIMARVLSEAGNINLYNIKLPCVGQLCYNFTAQTDYMTSSALRQALHIRSESPAWSTCDDTVNRDFTVKDRISSFRQDIALNLEAKVQVTIYNGKLDLICNYVGGYSVAKAIQWSGATGFNQAPLNSWTVGGSVAGQSQKFENLLFLQVDGAGHMVPHDQPVAALSLLEDLIQRGSSSVVPDLKYVDRAQQRLVDNNRSNPMTME